MALIVEDGTGSNPQANCYADAAFVSAFLTERGFTVPPSPAVDGLILRAMDAAEGLNFKGRKTHDDQPLKWPRQDVFINENGADTLCSYSSQYGYGGFGFSGIGGGLGGGFNRGYGGRYGYGYGYGYGGQDIDEIADDEIPSKLQTALAWLVYYINAGNDPAAVAEQQVTRERIEGAVEIEYYPDRNRVRSETLMSDLPNVNTCLLPYLRGGGVSGAGGGALCRA